MRIKILTVLLTLLFAGSYQQVKPVGSETIPTISFCELIRNSALYSGKTVRVKATWEYGFEWSFLYYRECMDNRAWVKFVDEDALCAGSEKKLKKIKNKGFDNKADVIVIGKLSTSAETGQSYGDGGYDYQFVVSCMEDARRISYKIP